MESTETPELQITSAEDIRKKAAERRQGKPVKLPSGVVMGLVKMDVPSLVSSGVFPSDLVGLATNMADKMAVEDAKKKTDQTPEEMVEQMKKMTQITKAMVVSCIATPKVVEGEPKDGEITFEDIAEEDKDFILKWAMEDYAKVQSFREGGAGTSGRDGSDLPSVSGEQAEPDNGDTEPVDSPRV